MAKKRKSKQNKMIGQSLSVGTILFAIATICMVFVTSVKYTEPTLYLGEYTGVQTIFGYTAQTGGGFIDISKKVLDFSFMNLLPYLLTIGGALVALMNLFGKNKWLWNVVSCVLFIVAAVFFFTANQYVCINENVATMSKEYFEIGVGSILAGSFFSGFRRLLGIESTV